VVSVDDAALLFVFWAAGLLLGWLRSVLTRGY